MTIFEGQVVDKPEFGAGFNENVYEFDFYSGAQISIYIGDVLIDDINSIQYNVVQKNSIFLKTVEKNCRIEKILNSIHKFFENNHLQLDEVRDLDDQSLDPWSNQSFGRNRLHGNGTARKKSGGHDRPAVPDL